MKLGKKINYINSDVFTQNFNIKDFYFIKEPSMVEGNDDVYLLNTQNNISDNIRYYSKNFWTSIDGEIANASNINYSPMINIKHLNDDVYVIEANKEYFLKDEINSRGILERKYNEKLWLEFTTTIIPSKEEKFIDNYFISSEPIDLKKEKNFIEKNINYLDVEFKYNFHSLKYENLIANKSLEISKMPSIFDILADPKLDIRTREENIYLSLGGSIPDNYVESLFISKQENELIKNYYDFYATSYANPEFLEVVNNLDDRRVININEETIKLINAINYVPFPMYCDIKLHNLSFDNNNLIKNVKNFGDVYGDLKKILYFRFDTIENLYKDTSFVTDSKIETEKNLFCIDFKTMIEKGIDDGLNIFYEFNKRPYMNLDYDLLKNYVRDNLKNKARRYEDLHIPCYNEILFYEIEKRNKKDGNIIQKFVFEANNSESLRLVDTQIKYDTEYYYTVYAYVIVIGNTYSYEDYYGNNLIEYKRDIEQGIHKIKINNKANYNIYRIKHSEFYGSTIQQPPTKPNLIVNHIENTVSFKFENIQQESRENMRIVENKDFNIFEKIKKYQNNEDEMIKCSISNKEKLYIQIYKSINKPVNYLSFQGKLYKNILSSQINTFEDIVIPNIKHYYMFRYVNEHGIPSNVSKVYEIELVDEDGYYYLKSSIVDLEKTADKKLTKNLKRYLLIRPSVIQTQLRNTKDSGDLYDIGLGPDKEQVWNKDFILRIVSKKTNRTLEFNLKSIINRKKE